MNELDCVVGAELSARTIETVTGEILEAKRVGGEAILTIGKGLIEAKGLLGHGEWLPWLNEQVEFSERTAQNFMRLAKEYTNPQTVADLGASKALALLALPENEREGFVAAPHAVDGEEKSVAEMSTRELEQAIRERDEARQQLETVKKERAAQKEKIGTLCDNAKKSSEQIATLEKELTELKARPVDVAVQVDESAVKAAQAERDKALTELDALRSELEKARAARPAPAPDDALAQFGLLFEQVQETINRMNGLRMKFKDPEIAEKCARAMRAIAERLGAAA